MSIIFWIAVLALLAVWAYKHQNTVKGWFKKFTSKKDKAPSGGSTPDSGCAPAASDGNVPPSQAPPGP